MPKINIRKYTRLSYWARYEEQCSMQMNNVIEYIDVPTYILNDCRVKRNQNIKNMKKYTKWKYI